ncbi:MAG: DEAD/DEAH box helicase [Magnetococcales bacterium]|nr:DEAD/DEAH box helicase [Magnetococcales bacterium]
MAEVCLSGFELLHPKIQKWVWEKNWVELKDAQEQAIPPILTGSTDLLIGAATASGKTEAAFLPILSRLLTEESQQGVGVRVLYLSPLKALINDQFGRTESLCKQLDIPVYSWHGDVPQAKKRKVLKEPDGILLITPESLEAIHIVHGHNIQKLFGRLQYVVVDELHSFIGTERGVQLQSLLHRIELVVRRVIPRIGLSATLGDMEMAAQFLRPGNRFPYRIIQSSSGSPFIQLRIRGYLHQPPKPVVREEEEAGDLVFQSIAEDMYKVMRGKSHLIFANSRSDVEIIADYLRRLCERYGVPNEFWPHHGSLSKEIRESAEAALKDQSRPATAICTSTLEMGIDIGMVESVAQVGPPPSVASMKQRLGRSGRRGNPAALRVYIREDFITPQTSPHDLLRTSLIQTIAMIRLLGRQWVEPPSAQRPHFSTLVHQILSIIAQFGGVAPVRVWQALCETGPFVGLDSQSFSLLLKNLGKLDIITQAGDGTLVLGLTGERLVNHYSYYAVFKTPEEYRLVSYGRTLGTIPIDFPLVVDTFLIFAGKRWQIVAIHENEKVVELKPARGGRPPIFSGEGALVHDEIRKEMAVIYKTQEIPPYLDVTAANLLSEGRANFYRLGLDSSLMLEYGKDTLLFPWRGDQILNTMVMVFGECKVSSVKEGVSIRLVGLDLQSARQKIAELAKAEPFDPVVFASVVRNKNIEKYHYLVTEDLLSMEYAATHFDVKGCQETLVQLSDVRL